MVAGLSHVQDTLDPGEQDTLDPGESPKLDPGESPKLDPGRRHKFSPAVDKHYPGKYSPGIKFSPDRLRKKERET